MYLTWPTLTSANLSPTSLGLRRLSQCAATRRGRTSARTARTPSDSDLATHAHSRRPRRWQDLRRCWLGTLADPRKRTSATPAAGLETLARALAATRRGKTSASLGSGRRGPAVAETSAGPAAADLAPTARPRRHSQRQNLRRCWPGPPVACSDDATLIHALATVGVDNTRVHNHVADYITHTTHPSRRTTLDPHLVTVGFDAPDSRRVRGIDGGATWLKHGELQKPIPWPPTPIMRYAPGDGAPKKRSPKARRLSQNGHGSTKAIL